jgi:hypothetical protein
MRGGFLEAVSEGVVSGAVAEDVFSCLSGFAAGALILAIEGEALSEFACVTMPSSTEIRSGSFMILRIDTRWIPWMPMHAFQEVVSSCAH